MMLTPEILKKLHVPLSMLPEGGYTIRGCLVVPEFVTSLGRLQSIEGSLSLPGNSTLVDLGDLDIIEGSLDASGAKCLKTLGNLHHVEGSVNICGAPVTSLGRLSYVGRHLDACLSSLADLGKLRHVGGTLDLRSSRVTSLGILSRVGDYIDLRDTSVCHPGNMGLGVNVKLDGHNNMVHNLKATVLFNLQEIARRKVFTPDRTLGGREESTGNHQTVSSRPKRTCRLQTYILPTMEHNLIVYLRTGDPLCV